MIERVLSLKMVTAHHATSMSSQGGGRSSVGLSRSLPSKSAVVYFFLYIIIISFISYYNYYYCYTCSYSSIYFLSHFEFLCVFSYC